ncbi:monocarboxylate transporter 2 [Ciona intestinalis]
MVRCTLKNETKLKKPPNGGWGWVVVFASFCVDAIAFAVGKGLGMFFTGIKEEFNASNSEVSLVLSLFFACMGFAGLVVGLLIEILDVRKILLLCGVVSCGGLTMCAFSPSIGFMYFGSVLSGLACGSAFIASSSHTVIYFSTLMPLANGIVLTGSPIGATFVPYFNKYLLSEYGWRGGMFILAGISLNFSSFGALVRPIAIAKVETAVKESHEHVSNGNRVFAALKKYWLALLFLFFNVLFALAAFVPNVYIVPFAESKNYSEADCALFLSLISVGDIFCRPLAGAILTKSDLCKKYILSLVAFLMILFSAAQLLLVHCSNFFCLVLYTSLYGCLYGSVCTATMIAMPLLIGKQNLERYYGAFFTVGGVSTLIGVPFAGSLVDAHGRFEDVFLYAFVCTFAGGIYVLILSILKCCKSRQEAVVVS